MRKYFKLRFCLFFMFVSVVSLPAQQVHEISVLANKTVSDIQPTMWGVFFEDINFAADGGIYAELVKNRSFEFSLPLMGWKQVGQNGNGRVVPTFYSPANAANPHFITIVVDAETGTFGLSNEGFRGMGIRENIQYNFSVSARIAANSNLKMKLELVNQKGEVLGGTELEGFTTTWKKYQASFKATRTESKALLYLFLSGKGTIDLDMVALFPSDTWKDRPYGLRKDLVQMVADLYPVSKPVTVSGKKIDNTLEARSANVIVLRYKN